MRQLLYEISHETTCRYAGSVAVSHHLLRLTPRQTERQQCLSHDLAIEPAATVMTAHHDYFGNLTHFLGIEHSHLSLRIKSTSRVALRPASIPDASETPPWESVRARYSSGNSEHALQALEFTYASSLVPVGPEFAEYAMASFPKGRPILEAVAHLMNCLHRDFCF